ncbi:MAG: CrcB family protein [Nocardioides sp.]|nr:CrcB family protein [Nocardioides sp.]
MTALLVVVGAAAGTALRHAWSVALDSRWPIGTLLANTVGSGLFGCFAALSLTDAGWALLGTGFCGAFTTFSSFAVQAVDRPPRQAAAYVLATVVMTLGVCVLGWQLGSSLRGGLGD